MSTSTEKPEVGANCHLLHANAFHQQKQYKSSHKIDWDIKFSSDSGQTVVSCAPPQTLVWQLCFKILVLSYLLT